MCIKKVKGYTGAQKEPSKTCKRVLAPQAKEYSDVKTVKERAGLQSDTVYHLGDKKIAWTA